MDRIQTLGLVIEICFGGGGGVSIGHIRRPGWRQTVTGLSTAKTSPLILKLLLAEASLVKSTV